METAPAGPGRRNERVEPALHGSESPPRASSAHDPPAGTPALQWPPLHVMLPATCLTAPAPSSLTGASWIDAPKLLQSGHRRTRVRSTGFDVTHGGRLLCRSAQNAATNHETARNLQNKKALARLSQTSHRAVMRTGNQSSACHADQANYC
jgi:hypothetical protein